MIGQFGKNNVKLNGMLSVPGDKSISHRSVMLGSIAQGTTEIHGFLPGNDCLSTIGAFQKMGVTVERDSDHVKVYGHGLHGLKAPGGPLDMGNSGTTTRLISGILSAQPFSSVITGDDSLCGRPMDRIILPLARMGASISSIRGNGCAPLAINGKSLHGIHYVSPVASAQVKSALLLAGLYAAGKTSVTEPYLSRDHTEKMLSAFGAEIESSGFTAAVSPCDELFSQEITIPGDISSAAYFIAAGLIVPNSEITIRGVGTNPTRAGILDVCRQMGGSVTVSGRTVSAGEEAADLTVRSSELHGTVISGSMIPTLIDEIPVIAVMACRASGTTVIRDAAELKVKESNRIETVVSSLSAMGADIEGTEDGMIIHGGRPLKGAFISTRKDHRIAMASVIASLIADGSNTYDDTGCIDVSYPGFFEALSSLEH